MVNGKRLIVKVPQHNRFTVYRSLFTISFPLCSWRYAANGESHFGLLTLWSFTTILVVLNFPLKENIGLRGFNNNKSFQLFSEVCKLEEKMPAILERYNKENIEMLMNPMQSSPFVHGFNLASETSTHSDSQGPELASTWDKHENTKPGDPDEDLELHQLMEDIKRYIRSIDISNL
jgi:hypothetical protein